MKMVRFIIVCAVCTKSAQVIESTVDANRRLKGFSVAVEKQRVSGEFA
jgi:hypothetical protein